jgi:hypothetical protein
LHIYQIYTGTMNKTEAIFLRMTEEEKRLFIGRHRRWASSHSAPGRRQDRLLLRLQGVAVPLESYRLCTQLSEWLSKLLGSAADRMKRVTLTPHESVVAWGLKREEVGENVAELLPVNRLGKRAPECLGEIRDAELGRVWAGEVNDGNRPEGLNVRAHDDAVLCPTEANIQEDRIGAIRLHRRHGLSGWGGSRYDLMPHPRHRALEGQCGNHIVFHDYELSHQKVPPEQVWWPVQ